jgi:hypothetical protein
MNFVLDKNTMISACTGENPNTRQVDVSAVTMMGHIIVICHRFVVTKEIEVDYIKIFDQFKAGKQSPATVMGSKFYFYAKQLGKVDDSRTSSQLPHLQDETGIKSEDIPFARLASISNSTLVTYDGPLRQKLGNRAQEPHVVLRAL